MTEYRSFALPALLLLAVGCGLIPPSIFREPAPDSFDLYVDYVRPEPREAAWRNIPWQPSFAEGMRRAAENKQPLLFWAMNGHPLGCT